MENSAEARRSCFSRNWPQSWAHSGLLVGSTPGAVRARSAPRPTTVGVPAANMKGPMKGALMLSSLKSRLALFVAILAFGAFGAVPAASAHHRCHRHHHHHCIPQHNGGDHDADNNGGPTDGDGGV